ncbi:hypothetical protein TNCV_4218781 [Trichonephila clavipes]|nr:hypothetical protein TNCV_4218781 [Trichonephila clavipes]
MANWYGCPCFPKPPKGTAKINRNSYTNLYNSLIRPNLSYAQATSGKPTITNKNPQQMAPRRPETSRQTETVVQTPPIINRNVNPQTSSTRAINQNQNVPNINTTNNNSDIKALLSTTVQCLIQLLNAMNTTPAIANNFDTVSSAQADANQINDRPTSKENYRAFGGTLILVKNSIKHYSLPTPSMQTIEATIVILTPIDHDPISIVSIYIPPRSDEYAFTIDIENLIQTSSNCVLFGDFNAPHTAWNCNTNSSRGSTKNVKKELRKYSNENWTAKLKALDTQDNSLWAVQKFLKNKRSDIPPLNCSSGTAVTDTQKANILAESILDNFTENSRPNNDYDDVDELINNTVNSFLSLPTSTTTETAYPSEIISYIKKSNSKKAPALRHELRNPHDPGNYSNDWLDQSAASYMLAGYSPQSFHIYFSDMGWRLASRAICPENVTVVIGCPLIATLHNIQMHLPFIRTGIAVKAGSSFVPPALASRSWSFSRARDVTPVSSSLGRSIPPASPKGCGSPVVMVSNHGRHVMSSIQVPLKTRRVPFESSPVGVVWS